jgi:predicted phage-related endonuclease
MAPATKGSQRVTERDRREYLGGHDVAAILGLHPYKSPFAVWLAKTGPPEPEQGESYWVGYPSEAAYWGALPLPSSLLPRTDTRAVV